MTQQEMLASFSQPVQERRIMAAWERFLQSGEVAPNTVRPLIEESWGRCRSAGINPALTQASTLLTDEELMAMRARYRDLLEASVPIMAQAREILSESGTIMILTDPRGVILQTEGDPATVDAARHIRLQTGADWHERACGTNAIGTALAVGGPVQVHAAEHFCAGIKPWTCSATVVRDPSDGEVLAVLDVSGLRGAFDRHALALAMTAAGRIEERLAGRELAWRQRLLEAGLGRLTRMTLSGVLVFDRQGRLVQTDARAGDRLLDMGFPLDLKPDLRIDAFSLEDSPQAGEAKLPQWLRPEWVEPVIEAGIGLGTLVVLPESPRRGSGQRTPHSTATARASGGELGSLGHIIGHSAPFRQALEKAMVLAERDVPVLLQGETGVGKEVFARAIHAGGPRQHGPFVALNCGGLPRDLVASELFGYVEGAFSGARRTGRIGRIEAAHGGTLFLDEIGEMPLDLQPSLLRVLEDGEVYPLGENRPRKVAFRLVAASNRDVRAEVAAGRFRMDLFYRVSVTSLVIPALRERQEDIPALVEHFSRDVARRHGMSVPQFQPDVLRAFANYAWPGNVRELRNVVEGLVLMTADETITVADLPVELAALTVAGAPTHGAPASTTVTSLDAVERDAITAAILTYHGNLTQVAHALHMAKSTLYLKIQKYGLHHVLRTVRPNGR
jgi:sigma-54 dependent transcriptional regulator, acetoin dehydrogenase operon transcriptional activator AcoR